MKEIQRKKKKLNEMIVKVREFLVEVGNSQQRLEIHNRDQKFIAKVRKITKI